MNKLDFLTRWRFQLTSSNSNARIAALLEITEMLKSLKEDNKESIHAFLINSDICYFLSEITSLRDKTGMDLINKIVCHLSKSEKFFINDFFRILKGYARVINSFPDVIGSEENEKFQESIFNTANTLIRR